MTPKTRSFSSPDPLWVCCHIICKLLTYQYFSKTNRPLEPNLIECSLSGPLYLIGFSFHSEIEHGCKGKLCCFFSDLLKFEKSSFPKPYVCL